MADEDGGASYPFWNGESDSSQRLVTLVNAVDDGIYQLDADSRFVAVNDAVVETTGYARDELLGEHVSTVVEDVDSDRLEREIRTRVETGTDPDTTFNLVLETADGDCVPCELRYNLLVTDGEFDGTVGIVRTVQDYDRAHGSLPSVWMTDGSISSIIDEADIGVFVLDDEFDVVWVDESVEEFFGVDRTETIGRDKPALIQETIRDRIEDPDTFVETVLATYEDNTYVERFECRITPGPDRKGRWLEHRSKPIESGPYAGGRIELYYDITERKKAEHARDTSEQQFKSLIDAVEEYAIFRLDPDGHVASWNDGAKQIKGYSSAEILGEHFSTFYTESDRADGVPERNLIRAKEEGTIEDEGWRVRAEGSLFWANVTMTAIFEDGELQGYAKITRDMTERREWEQQLRREHDLTEQILETSPIGIAVVNPDGTTLRTNERMAELLDLSGDDQEIYTTAQREMYDADGEFLPIGERPVSRVFETGESITDREILIKRDDESRQWLSINAKPITNEDGIPVRVVETATDITDLKEVAERRKQELEEREKELTAIRLATSLLETGEQPVNELLQEFVTIIPQFFRYSERTNAYVSVGGVEATTDAYEHDGQQITASGKTANGKPITIDVVLSERNDVSDTDTDGFLEEEQELIDTLTTLLKFYFDRHEYIADLQTSNERLEQFAHAASHDLQEPLRMVSSYLQLIECQYADELDEDGKEFLDYAVNGAERMSEMIDRLLEYSRVETGGEPFTEVDLDAVFSAVLDDLRFSIEETDAEITVDSLPRVRGDPNQLRQVFQNLLENAIEYSGKESPRIDVTAERSGDEWIVSVSDEGIGISTDDSERIFEVFHRLHTHEEHAGSGIGLALCQRILERHGGDIWVESEGDEGSTFSFTLPTAETDR